MKPEKKASCPRCGEPALLAQANPWRPFCSERCKLIDLGDWVAGRYSLPAEDQETPPADETPRQ